MKTILIEGLEKKRDGTFKIEGRVNHAEEQDGGLFKVNQRILSSEELMKLKKLQGGKWVTIFKSNSIYNLDEKAINLTLNIK